MRDDEQLIHKNEFIKVNDLFSIQSWFDGFEVKFNDDTVFMVYTKKKEHECKESLIRFANKISELSKK